MYIQILPYPVLGSEKKFASSLLVFSVSLWKSIPCIYEARRNDLSPVSCHFFRTSVQRSETKSGDEETNGIPGEESRWKFERWIRRRTGMGREGKTE